MKNYLQLMKDLVVKGPTMQSTVMRAYNHGIVEAFTVGLTYYAITGDELNALGATIIDGSFRTYQAALSLTSYLKKTAEYNERLAEDLETIRNYEPIRQIVKELEIKDIARRISSRKTIIDLSIDAGLDPKSATRWADEALAGHEDGLARFMSGSEKK